MASFNDLMKKAKQAKSEPQSSSVVNDSIPADQFEREQSADGLYELGLNYYFGQNGYEEDNEKAYECFLKSSEMGNFFATGILGTMYMHGHYVDTDLSKAKDLLTIAVEHDVIPAMNDLGDLYREECNFKEAFEIYSKSADRGNAYGLYQIGLAYYYGVDDVVKEDEEKALRFLLRSANSDYDLSYFYIGSVYAHKEQYAEAYKWYKKSADAGYYAGMCGLGKLYYFGHGMSEDYDEAFKYFSQAADGDNAEACFLLGHMFEFGNGVSENHSKAMSYYRKAADLGDDRAKNAVSYNGWANIPDDEDSYENEYNLDDYDSVEELVTAIIVEKLGVEEEEVTYDASIVDDLDADSLDAVELIMEFEKTFGIEIPEDDAETITTVGEAIDYIKSRVN